MNAWAAATSFLSAASGFNTFGNIADDYLRLIAHDDQLNEFAHYPLARDRSIGGCSQALASNVTDDVERL